MKSKNLLYTGIVWFAAIINGMAQLPSYVPSNGIIAWYSFNGNTNDDSGNNNNGTNNGAVLTTDRYGNAASAYLFDGTSSYITIPTSASLESPTTAVTFSAWVNLAGFSLVGQAFGPVLTKSNNSANAFMYRFTVDMNGTGYYAGTNNWTTNIGASFPFQLNQWYLLSAVLSSDSAYFYINDSLIATQPFSTNIQNNTLPLEIGRDMPGITEVFNGKLDDIGIWNRALSPQEITNLFYGPTVGINKPSHTTQPYIYPNPATHQFTIYDLRFTIEKIEIFNALGQKVFSQHPLATSQQLTINISDYPKGIYYIVLKNAERTSVHKIIIQ